MGGHILGKKGLENTPLSHEEKYFHIPGSPAEEEGEGPGTTGKVVIREASPG